MYITKRNEFLSCFKRNFFVSPSLCYVSDQMFDICIFNEKNRQLHPDS